jgi:organic radical activating enzyme
MDLIDSLKIINPEKVEYLQPSNVNTEITQLINIIPNFIQEYEKNYVLFRTFPNNNEYTKEYENSKSNLEKINAKIFMINNNIQLNFEKLNQGLNSYNKKIYQLKKENKQTKKLLSQMENKNLGSEEMIENYQEMYNIQYFQNFTLLIGIFIGIFLFSNVFLINKKNT